MEQKEKDEQIADILKTIEEGFEKERNDPDPEVREQAIRETEMLKRQASSLLDSIIHVGPGIQELPLPNGYRLPTEEEYHRFSQMQAAIKTLQGNTWKQGEKPKKEMVQQYRNLKDKLYNEIESKKIYFIRESNRFTRKP